MDNKYDILMSMLLDFYKLNNHELNFAFICGSLLTSDMDFKGDIDLFVCIRDRSPIKTQVQDFYFKLHEVAGLRPDFEYPGEIVEETDLETKLDLTLKSEATSEIHDADLYDGIVWAGMISGHKSNILGNTDVYNKYSGISLSVVDKWYKKLSKGFDFQDEVVSPDKFLKHKIIYIQQ